MWVRGRMGPGECKCACGWASGGTCRGTERRKGKRLRVGQAGPEEEPGAAPKASSWDGS